MLVPKVNQQLEVVSVRLSTIFGLKYNTYKDIYCIIVGCIFYCSTDHKEPITI